MLKRQVYNIVLALLIILENLFLFYFYQKDMTSQTVNSIGFFATSVLIGLVILAKFYNAPEIEQYPVPEGKRKYLVILLCLGCLFGLTRLMVPLVKAFDPIKLSDIIPTVQILAKRCVAGQYPYDPKAYAVLGQPGAPLYLPTHWLPYTISDFFHFDPRYISFGIWGIAAFLVMVRTMRSNQLWLQLTIPALMYWIYWFMATQYTIIVTGTIEIMVAGYYMLLMVSLNQKNILISGFCIAVCMLSRYYIAMWLPLWVFVLFVSGQRKQLLKTMLVVLFFISVLYVIPFLSKDWSFLYDSMVKYGNMGMGEWFRLNDKGQPYHLYCGTGFAHLFYHRYLPTDLNVGYRLLKKALFLSLSCSVLVMGIWYWFCRKKINSRIFLMVSFKIYLSVFLAFIMVPYSYLMITGTFLSIAIFAEQARYRLIKKDK